MVARGGHLSAATKAKISASLLRRYAGHHKAKPAPKRRRGSGVRATMTLRDLPKSSQANILGGAKKRMAKTGQALSVAESNLAHQNYLHQRSRNYPEAMIRKQNVGHAAQRVNIASRKHNASIDNLVNIMDIQKPHKSLKSPHAKKALPTTGKPSAKKILSPAQKKAKAARARARRKK